MIGRWSQSPAQLTWVRPPSAGQAEHSSARFAYPNGAKNKPTRGAVRWAVNEPVVRQFGNPPQPFRHFRMAEHCTPGRESGPRSFECWFN